MVIFFLEGAGATSARFSMSRRPRWIAGRRPKHEGGPSPKVNGPIEAIVYTRPDGPTIQPEPTTFIKEDEA